jgi:16S rRNA (uracil1498-N3)-methyltransferase
VRHTFRYRLAEAPTAGMRVTLPARDAHHLLRVVRRGPGDRIEVIAPSGTVWPAVVVTAQPEAVVELGGAPLRSPETASVTLFVGLCEWGRLDVAVEKCTELGIGRIVVYAGARSRRIPDPAAWQRRRERLLRVADAATRQSGQGALPEIDGIWTFADVLAEASGGPAVVLDSRGEVPLGRAVSGAGTRGPIAVVVGPDAGLDGIELDRARAAGATICHLGRTTLRAETAAIVAAAVALEATVYLDPGPQAAADDQEDD